MVFTFLTWGAPLWAATGLTGMSIGWGLLLLRALLGYATAYGLLIRTGLPTFVAALALRSLSKKQNVTSWPVLFLPLAATTLFVAYNGMNLDALYTLYWVAVPVLFALLPRAARASHIARAIAASMAAHIVGSLIVLFAGFSISWFALMPIVLFERFVSVVGMSVVSWAVSAASRVWSARQA